MSTCLRKNLSCKFCYIWFRIAFFSYFSLLNAHNKGLSTQGQVLKPLELILCVGEGMPPALVHVGVHFGESRIFELRKMTIVSQALQAKNIFITAMTRRAACWLCTSRLPLKCTPEYWCFSWGMPAKLRPSIANVYSCLTRHPNRHTRVGDHNLILPRVLIKRTKINISTHHFPPQPEPLKKTSVYVICSFAWYWILNTNSFLLKGPQICILYANNKISY